MTKSGSPDSFTLVGKRDGSIIHWTNGISGERKNRIVRRSPIAEFLSSCSFGALNGFHRNKVRISSLPTSRQSRSVKINHDLVLSSIVKNIHVPLYHRLFVAVEKIYLH